MYVLYSEFEALYHCSVGVVRCGGFEVQTIRTVPLEQPSPCQLNFKLETVKFLQHINPDVQVRLLFCVLFVNHVQSFKSH
jgi:hypothetical protein